jgi:signal transduction histidine kinase
MAGVIESSVPQISLGVAQLMLDALPSCAIVVDPEGRVAAVILQAERVLGWAAAGLEGQCVHQVLDCRDENSGQSAEECPIARVLGGAPTRPQGKMRVRCRDQSFRPIEYGCGPFPTSKGWGAILAFRDLTRQIELETDLRRLASIAEASPIAIVELNEDANLVHANSAMMSLLQRFGFSSEARPAILPANIEKLTTQCLETQSEIGGIEVGVKQSYYEWKLVPVSGERLVRGYGIDITARKQAEIELLQAKVKAEAGMQAKSEFLANTKHEIRSPAYVISGIADLLAESTLDQNQLEYVNTIRASAESLTRVIDNILDLAALEEGATRFESSAVTFRSFMSEITASFAQQAEKKGLQFSVTVSHKIPVVLRCDRRRLTQLLNNLITNAIKFTERGEVVVEVDRDTIFSPSHGSGDRPGHEEPFYLFFSVRDTGIGIPSEKQQIIFDSFAQADGSATRSYEGTGLGLAISKQALELMGGTIGVESEPGKGSRFWFSFPVQDVTETKTVTTKATVRELTAPRQAGQ